MRRLLVAFLDVLGAVCVDLIEKLEPGYLARELAAETRQDEG